MYSWFFCKGKTKGPLPKEVLQPQKNPGSGTPANKDIWTADIRGKTYLILFKLHSCFIQNYNFFKIYFVCVYLSHVWRPPSVEDERGCHPLMLKLQVVISHPTAVWGTKLWSLEEQQVILTAEPFISATPRMAVFIWESSVAISKSRDIVLFIYTLIALLYFAPTSKYLRWS